MTADFEAVHERLNAILSTRESLLADLAVLTAGSIPGWREQAEEHIPQRTR